MARAKHVCPTPGCPNLTDGGRCDACRPAYERQRGTRQQRGYARPHDQLRRSWLPRVERGEVDCARCKQRILPGDAWALDHTDDRSGYLGPSHSTCNVRAAHKK